jgi:hypothetical protein
LKKTKLITFIIFGATLLSVCQAQAGLFDKAHAGLFDEGPIYGVVTQCGDDNEPFEHVKVSIDTGNGIFNTETDYDGSYRIEDLDFSYYTVVFSVGEAEKITTNIPLGELNICMCANTDPPIITTESLGIVVQGNPFLRMIEVEGCPPYHFSYTGVLPDNLTLDPESGTISGYFAVSEDNVGYFEFTITVTDSLGQSVSKTFGITVVEKLRFLSSQELTCEFIDRPLFFQVLVRGGLRPYIFDLPENMPDGLNFSSDGYISGTPTRWGEFTFNVNVTDASNQETNRQFALRIVSELAITTQSMDDAIVHDVYNMRFNATDGCGSYRWGVHSLIPKGLSIDRDSGVLSGIPKKSEERVVIITVMDENGHVAYKPFNIEIYNPLQISNGDLPDALIGEQYYENIDITGGKRDFSYEISIDMPNGLTFSMGKLFGVPTGPIERIPFEITVTDSTYPIPQEDTELIYLAVVDTLSITHTTILDPLPVNTQLRDPIIFNASAGKHPFEWQMLNGGIPYGTTFDTQLNKNGATITGTTKEPGDFRFLLEVTDDNGDTAQKQFYWRIYDDLKIINYSIPILPVNIPMKPIILNASGGLPPYTWHVYPLPEGLSFDSQTATIQGIPQSPMQTKLTLHVYDSSRTYVQTATKELNLMVHEDSLVVSPSELVDTAVNHSYRQFIQPASDSPPCYISLRSGPLPTGITITGNLENGEYNGNIELKGWALTPGVYPLKFKIRDSSIMSETIYQNYTITVHDVIQMTTNELPAGEPGKPYSECILVDGAEHATITYQITSGNLPKGLYLNRQTGTISGVIDPQATGTSFTIKVIKDVGEFSSSDERELTLYITGGSLTITTSFVRNPILNKGFANPIMASGGLKPYQWFTISYVLPQGAQLIEESNKLYLYGTPTQCGQFHVHAKIKDSASQPQFDSKLFPFEVACGENDDIKPQIPVLVKSYPDIRTQSTGIIRVIISQPEIDTDIAGYSYEWNTSMSSTLDTILETNQTEILSPQLSSGKNHYLHVCAVDTSNNISDALSVGPFYVSRPDTCVMIVGGGKYDPDDLYWQTTEKLTSQAYMDFFKMGYSHDQIFYVIHASDGIDYDHDNIPDDIVDNYLYESESNYAKNLVLQTIKTMGGVNSEQHFYIYMQGHATEDGRFRIKGRNDDYIDAQDLDEAFSELQRRKDCTIVLILESCFAGNFISQLSGDKRVITTSVGKQRYLIDTSARQVFSRYLLAKLRESKNLYDAYVSARDDMFQMGFPKALLDDNGDGISDATDGQLAKTIYPCNFLTWADKPLINSVSVDSVQGNANHLSITVNVLPGDVATNEISGAIIPSYSENIDTVSPTTFVLYKQSDTVFQGIVSDLSPDTTNRVILRANNRFGELSDPKVIARNQKIDLRQGWNLFSFSVNKVFYASDEPPNVGTLSNAEFVKVQSLNDILEGIQGKYELIRNFDDQGATTYDPGVPDFFNTLHYLAAGYGYWIKMKEPASLTFSGALADASDTFPLRAGWNLMGCWHSHTQYDSDSYSSTVLHAQSVQSLTEVFRSIDGKYEIVRNYDDKGAQTFDPRAPGFFNTLKYVSPGYGIWIRMKEEVLFHY